MMDFLKAYKPALYFLVIFIGLYLLLNSFYGLYIQSYYPAADPLTISISRQVSAILSWVYGHVAAEVLPDLSYITLRYEGAEIINVFEGCNGLNVMIVYLAFLFAFSGRLKSTMYYLVGGLLLLYLVNLLRVMLLFAVSFHFPQQLYFFHKYFFTAMLYLFVFILWYAWVKKVKRDAAQAHGSSN